MPENLRIAVFVLGAILLLIGLLGGNFKLFGGDIAATVSNPLLRFVSFALGVTFLIIAIHSLGVVKPPVPPPLSPNHQGREIHPPPPEPDLSGNWTGPDLSGNWTGTDGFLYKFEQQNNSITVQKIDPQFMQATATGKGEIRDGKVVISCGTISQPGGIKNFVLVQGRLHSDEYPPTILFRP